MTKHIISIGGGGFGRSIGDLKIEKYILSQSNKDKPNICSIPTATGDDSGYIENFYKALDQLGAKTSHLDFFIRTPFWAVFNYFPVQLPFFSPSKWALTN